MELKNLARELGQKLKETNEFKEYQKYNNEVYLKDKDNKKLIDDFRKKSLEYQINYQKTGKDDPNEKSKLQTLHQILMTNPKIANYLLSEQKYFQIVEEVFQTIEEEIKLD